MSLLTAKRGEQFVLSGVGIDAAPKETRHFELRITVQKIEPERNSL